MSERREHKKRYNLRLEYIAKFNKWLEAEPPMILFWRWRKWKNNRPPMPNTVATAWCYKEDFERWCR